jgi:hypothetical protein
MFVYGFGFAVCGFKFCLRLFSKNKVNKIPFKPENPQPNKRHKDIFIISPAQINWGVLQQIIGNWFL